MDALAAMRIDAANQRLVSYLRARFPGRYDAIPDDRLRAAIDRMRGTAADYGIQRENDVATFLDFTVMYGQDFHRDAWAREILQVKELHGPDKMDVLRDRVRGSGVDL